MCVCVCVCSTFAWLVVDADRLRLVVAVVVLDADQVGVGPVVETRPHRQHVLVGLVHGLHQLQGHRISLILPVGGCREPGLSLIAAAALEAKLKAMALR